MTEFPLDFRGFLIRTDFKIIIEIIEILKSANLKSGKQKEFLTTKGLKLFYGRGGPSSDILAKKGLVWFLTCGKNNPSDFLQKSQLDYDMTEIFDYSKDINLIFSAFMRNYNLDIFKENMHWWKFMALLNDVTDCNFVESVNKRLEDIKYPKTKITNEEKLALNEFERKLKKGAGMND